jgi:hypothetical protein
MRKGSNFQNLRDSHGFEKKHGLCPISSFRKVQEKFKILRNASEADMLKRESWGSCEPRV